MLITMYHPPDIQADMVSICLEYVEGRAETIFIYGSYESRVLSCDYFFKVAGNLYERHKLPEGYDVSVDGQKNVYEDIVG